MMRKVRPDHKGFDLPCQGSKCKWQATEGLSVRSLSWKELLRVWVNSFCR